MFDHYFRAYLRKIIEDFEELAKNNRVEGKWIEEYLELTKILTIQNYFKFGGEYFISKN